MKTPIRFEWSVARPGDGRARRGSPLIALAGIVAILAAAVAAWHEVEPLVTFRPVTAIVLSAEVVRTGSGRTLASGASFAAGRSRSGYLPAVSFRYSVDGLERTGDHERRTGLVESMRDARLRIDGMAPGRPVTAWYNPWEPADSVLDRTPNPIGLILFVAVALVGAAMLAAGSPTAGGGEASGKGSSRDSESVRKSA